MLKNKEFIPIIHIIGLPGAGKSTLSKRLAKKLRVPVYCIGKYRHRFPTKNIGEADAWVALFYDLSKRGWGNCILETTGLNLRESFLEKALPLFQRITIKLRAKRKILYARIGKKKKNERGRAYWLFSQTYRDKYEFVNKMFGEFKNVQADIKIDTSEMRPYDVYKIALKELRDGIFMFLGEKEWTSS